MRTRSERRLSVAVACCAALAFAALFLQHAPRQHLVLAAAVVMLGLLMGVRPIFGQRYSEATAVLGSFAIVNILLAPAVPPGTPLASTLRIIALLGLFLIVASAIIRLPGLSDAAARVSFAATLMLGSVAFGVAFERMPGSRMGLYPSHVNKGLVPDRTFGTAYLPDAQVREYFATNPQQYFDAPPPMRRQWRLNVHNGSARASLSFPPGPVPTMRVQVDAAGTEHEWDIQLNRTGLGVTRNEAYVLRFSARASRPRTVSVRISEFHPPWQGLGYGQSVTLTEHWTWFTDTLTLDRSDDNSRLHFDIGGDTGTVEFASVTLTSLATAAEVMEAMPYALPHVFNQFGCRTGVPTVPPTTPAVRVLVLGDAFSFGIGVRDHDTFAARLQMLLNTTRPEGSNTRGRYDVMNCSVPGWRPWQSNRLYERLRDTYRPDVVLVSASPDDGWRGLDQTVVSSAFADTSAFNAWVEQDRRAVRALVEDVNADGARLALLFFRTDQSNVWSRYIQAVSEGLTGPRVTLIDLYPSLYVDSGFVATGVRRERMYPGPAAHARAASVLLPFIEAGGIRP